jgi:hypothetical protein
MAAVIGLVVLGGYIVLISAQGPTGGGGSRVPFFVVYWLALAAITIIGGRLIDRRPSIARPLLLAAGIGYLATGFLAMFSVGTPLLFAGLLALSASVGPGGRWPAMAVAMVVPCFVLVVGLGVTS